MQISHICDRVLGMTSAAGAVSLPPKFAVGHTHQNMERFNIINGKFTEFKIILPLFLSFSDYILYM